MQLRGRLKYQSSVMAPNALFLLVGIAVILFVVEAVAYLWRFLLVFVMLSPVHNSIPCSSDILYVGIRIRFVIVAFASYWICRWLVGLVSINGKNLLEKEQCTRQKITLKLCICIIGVMIGVYVLNIFQAWSVRSWRFPLYGGQDFMGGEMNITEVGKKQPVRIINMGLSYEPPIHWEDDKSEEEKDEESLERLFPNHKKRMMKQRN